MRFISTFLKLVSWGLGTGIVALSYHGVAILGEPMSFLALSLILGPAVVSICREKKPQNTLFWVVLLSISLRLIPPLSEGGTAFVRSGDHLFTFQVADIIAERGAWVWGLETERARQLIFFPGLEILTVQISVSTGLPLYQVARFLPVLLTAITIIFVFLTYSLMLDQRVAVIGAFLFSICYKYNWFDGTYIQESLGVVFFVIAFYSVMRATRESRRAVFLIFLLSVLVLVTTHFFSSLMLILSLGLCYALFHVTKRVHRRIIMIGVRDLLVLMVSFGAWLSLVGLVSMHIGINYGVDYLHAFLEFLENPFARQAVLPPTGIHLIIQETTIVYLGILVAGVVGAIGMARAIHVVRKAGHLRAEPAMVLVTVFCAITFAFGGLAVVGIFASPPENPDIPSRLVTSAYFFWAPAFGIGIQSVASRIGRLPYGKNRLIRPRIALAYLFLAILLILPAASTWLLMPSQMQGRVTLNDQEVTSISSWLRTSGDKRVLLDGDPVMMQAVGALSRQPLRMYGCPSPVICIRLQTAGMLYYGSNKTSQLPELIGEHFPGEPAKRSIYLIVNKAYLSEKYYMMTYYYESIPPPSADDISSSLNDLNAFSMLNRVYCSSSLTLYLSDQR